MKRTSHLIILFNLSFFISNYLLFFLFDFFLVVTSANPEYTVACLKSQVNDTNLLLLLLLLLSPLPLACEQALPLKGLVTSQEKSSSLD